MTLQNVRFKGLVETTAELESDKFAGRIGWNSTLARFVAYFSSTDYATMARKDLAETFPGLAATNLTQYRIVTVGANGQLIDDPGLTRVQAAGITTDWILGDGTDASGAGVISSILNASSSQRTNLVFKSDGKNRWIVTKTATTAGDTLLFRAFDASGTEIDQPISIENAAGGAITLGGYGATKRDVNLTGNLKIAGTQRISSAGRADFSSIYDSACAGGGVRATLTDNVGMFYAASAADVRSAIEVVGAELISVLLGDSTTNSTCWMKLCQVTINAQYQRMRAAVVVEQMANGLAAHSTTLLLRVDQSAAMSGNSPLVEMLEEFNGPGITVGYTLDQNDANSKVVSFWVKTAGTYTTSRYTVMLEQANVASRTWGLNVSPVTTQPTGWTNPTYAAKTIGSLKVTGQSGSVPRMVQAGTDGTQSAVDAATARATIDAAQSSHSHTFASLTSKPTTLGGYGISDAQPLDSDLTAIAALSTTAFGRSLLTQADQAEALVTLGAQPALGYTPANKAGDTFTGQVVITDPTNVVAQPKLLISVGGGSVAGMIGFHSDGAMEGSRNWAAGVSRDNSCFQINSYTDDWSGRNECLRVGIDYLDLSNSYANATLIGYRIGGVKVVGGRKTGWTAATGTATRSTFATSSVTLPQLAERVKAILDDLISHGLIGA